MSKDLHGKRALPRNILTNWGAQVAQMIAGFIVPRMLDRQLGTEALGVWDLVWSLVIYFNLVQMGVTSSINRYVAHHRAQEDFAGINRVVSSVAMIMRVMGGVVVLLSLGLAWGMGPLYQDRLGELLPVARWLVVIIGLGTAVQISSTVYGSILTGCHRWDWHNGIQAATNLLMLVGMVAALLSGYGLIGLAVVNLLAETAGRLARRNVVYHLCPWLTIRSRLFDRRTARDMMAFGGKSFLTNLSQLLLNSTTAALIGGYLGPAALALYARPMALVRNLNVFMSKYAMTFSPTFSSLQSAGKHDEVRDLMFKSLRYGLFIVLPMVVFLLVFGDEVLRLWMGDQFVNARLIISLQLGFLFHLAYLPLQRALAGLNLHGPPGWMSLAATGAALAATTWGLGFQNWTINEVAYAVGVPMALYSGVYLPLYTCRKLAVPVTQFLRQVWLLPVACCLPLAAMLVLSRFVLVPGSLLKAALLGTLLGAFVLLPCYWRFAFPPRLKTAVLNRLPFLDRHSTVGSA